MIEKYLELLINLCPFHLRRIRPEIMQPNSRSNKANKFVRKRHNGIKLVKFVNTKQLSTYSDFILKNVVSHW